jgi:hypothetical protein
VRHELHVAVAVLTCGVEICSYFRGMTQKGSDPTGPGFEAGNGATALHAAVEEGHANVVKMLLKHGVKQSGSMEGATPLILAAMYGHFPLVLLFAVSWRGVLAAWRLLAQLTHPNQSDGSRQVQPTRNRTVVDRGRSRTECASS